MTDLLIQARDLARHLEKDGGRSGAANVIIKLCDEIDRLNLALGPRAASAPHRVGLQIMADGRVGQVGPGNAVLNEDPLTFEERFTLNLLAFKDRDDHDRTVERVLVNRGYAVRLDPGKLRITPVGRERRLQPDFCDCERPEGEGVRLVSFSCPIHNENPDPPGDEEAPDCFSDREHELYFALMLITSHATAHFRNYRDWQQAGWAVEPIVSKALRLSSARNGTGIMEEADMKFLKQWREIPAQLATILWEIKLMRTSTQHLTEAIQALTTSVQNGNAKIKSELDALLQSHNDDDDAAVEASVAKIKELAGSIDAAVEAAQTAAANVPADQTGGAGSGSPQPQG